MVSQKSYIIGKPNPYVMKLIEKEHGLKAEEILMVGDKLETDIKIAKDCGIKLLNRKMMRYHESPG